MDFAMSKENIQPLRGGRNAVQLEVGLQAQHNPLLQEELMLQKQQFENAIQTYTGDDPLENHYQYIYWVEQSFPKHGHEGNFVNLLEDCLGRFESDPRYQNDLRFCKLWIKYIDLQYNHTELYQILYTKRICIGHADLYKAWAYYYEAAGDYKRADQVYKLGKAELAQPFQELEIAHHNFVYNAGFHMLNNGSADTQRLAEQRQALTKLQTFKRGHVGSVRVPTSSVGAGTLPMSDFKENARNAPLNVHEDYQDILFGLGAPPVSILSAVKRDTRTKENAMKPGVWTGVKKKTHTVHKTSSIPVHIDTPPTPHEVGIQLPANHIDHTKEDYTLWKVALCFPDPPNPNQIAMYCKAQCYAEANKEYSIEEVRARRYTRKTKRDVGHDWFSMETDVSQRSNASMEVSDASLTPLSPGSFQPPQLHQQQPTTQPPAPQHANRVVPYVSPPRQILPQQMPSPHPQHMYNTHVPSPLHHPQYAPHPHAVDVNPHLHSHTQTPPVHTQSHYTMPTSSAAHHSPTPFVGAPMEPFPRHTNSYKPQLSYEQHVLNQPHQHHAQQVPPSPQMPPHTLESVHYANNSYQQVHQPHSLVESSAYSEAKSYANFTLQPPQPQHASYHHQTITSTPYAPDGSHHQQQHADVTSTPLHSSHAPSNSPSPNVSTLAVFGGDGDDLPPLPVPTQLRAHFIAYADSPAGNSWYQPRMEPTGNAMKTPIKILSDDELAETGSRGGLDVAAAAQPTDGAKRVYEDEDSIAGNTEVFNLNAMHVSTPQNKVNDENAVRLTEAKSTKKRLFSGLSDIIEESNYSSASGGSSSTSIAGSVARGGYRQPMDPISEQSYHFNLSQNMKANAELRMLLGMGCDSGPESPSVQKQPSTYENFYQEQHHDPKIIPYEDEPQEHVPYSVLNVQPTDPFTNKMLEMFLAHVKFPGRHRRSYQRINGVPKLAVKKDPCTVGHDRYIVEKQLGKGSYGSVYKATRCGTGEVVALKFQKPPNKWEFYICKEIQARLADHPLRECFMDVQLGYFSDLASVLVSDVHNCSLLDLVNTIKSQLINSAKHHLSIHFTSEMMKVVQALHSVKIIHADIKPDNFLVMVRHDSLQLQLIDFGCSIDMSLMPEGTSFMRKVKTDSFQCCEMKDDRPWNYHTDLFCIAATAHTLLLESYIDVKNVDGRWYISKKIPRYYRDELWSVFFNCMLNMQEGLADLESLITMFADALDHKELRSATTQVINSFKNR